jgi:hypothetical protein
MWHIRSSNNDDNDEKDSGDSCMNAYDMDRYKKYIIQNLQKPHLPNQDEEIILYEA